MSDPFLMELLAPIEADIKAATLASLELSADNISSYTFNSGQTTQTVTKRTLTELQKHINALMARRDALRQRLGLASSTYYAKANY